PRTIKACAIFGLRHSPVTNAVYLPASRINTFPGSPRGPRSAAPAHVWSAMFAFFERLLKPTQVPERPEPPADLVAFYWHFPRRPKPLFLALFAAGFAVAVLDTLIPVFFGRVVTLITANPPDQLLERFWPLLLAMALVLLILRPAALVTQAMIANQ